MVVITFFCVLRINGLQNTNEYGIGPWFSIPDEEILYTEKRGGGEKMSVSEKKWIMIGGTFSWCTFFSSPHSHPQVL